MRLPLFAAIIFLIVGCSKKEPTSVERGRVGERVIGINASIAAGFHVEAERACQIAGIQDVEVCSKNDGGTLLPEMEARSVALVSVSQTKKYFDSCLAEFPASYCNDLMERAIEMERRKPVSAEAPVQLER